ncbi:MAG: anaerobic carbon-monoxide dehydrogenase catalytic subunit [Chloroflexi bacterium]|nr:anaerobic carbon-monoxide dehydrogenase catalytic subunit [Chloroflexota bacterium]MBE3114393.1 anaerobic carbon-monoxide dehydrogenase catalytic subunit [Actinomycetota bacterium]
MKEEREEKKYKEITEDRAVIEIMEKMGGEVSTIFDRSESMKYCPIGSGISGICCKNCAMGPCRVRDDKTGLCGATLGTIAARNLARHIAAGAAAHSDHGRDMAHLLGLVAEDKAEGLKIKDEFKLMKFAKNLGVKIDDRDIKEIAKETSEKALSLFGQQTGEIDLVKIAPEKRQGIWRKYKIVPRGIDREIVETMHRTNMGVDQDAEHILDQALRTALSDGWGGSMIGTEITDILFTTPEPRRAKTNLGMLKEDEVNIVVHGHEPTLSEIIAELADDKKLLEYAKSKGASGINVVGICCTANEILMRQGIAPIGNFLSQEMAIMTRAVEVMVVDIQCIMQSLGELAKKYHTKLITSSPKCKIPGAIHMEFEENNGVKLATEIIRMAIDNFKNRKKEVYIPRITSDLVCGFSHEYIKYMLGGKFRESFRPLNDAIIDGRIQGVVGVVGCNNARITQDKYHNYLTRELIKRDYLVVATGCGALSTAKCGLMIPEALEYAGEGLRSICEAVGMPPVLHLGSCVDNSRILTVVSEIVREGGLGEDISDLPIAGIAPEWMSEKALSIGSYFAASGAYVAFSGEPIPVESSSEVKDIMTKGWQEKYGGQLEYIADIEELLDKVISVIQEKRKALRIDIKKERVLLDMEARRTLKNV